MTLKGLSYLSSSTNNIISIGYSLYLQSILDAIGLFSCKGRNYTIFSFSKATL